MEENFSVEEVARRCQTTPEAVGLWIDLGLLQASPAEGGPVVSLSVLLEFLNHYSLPSPIRSASPLKKILAVDDEPHILEVVRGVFERDSRLQLDTAENGFEGLIRFGQLRPDLVVLDIYMPEMNGVEVCRRLKRHPEFRNTRLVIITGFPQDDLFRELQAVGVDRVLVKPVSIDELGEVVYDLLGLPRMDAKSGNPHRVPR